MKSTTTRQRNSQRRYTHGQVLLLGILVVAMFGFVQTTNPNTASQGTAQSSTENTSSYAARQVRELMRRTLEEAHDQELSRGETVDLVRRQLDADARANREHPLLVGYIDKPEKHDAHWADNIDAAYRFLTCELAAASEIDAIWSPCNNAQMNAVAALGNDDRWFASGVLIEPDQVLCNIPENAPRITKVTFEPTVASDRQFARTYSVVDIANHGDLQILTLNRPVNYVQPLPMATVEECQHANRARLVGYGGTEKSGLPIFNTRSHIDVACDIRPDHNLINVLPTWSTFDADRGDHNIAVMVYLQNQWHVAALTRDQTNPVTIPVPHDLTN